jgi:hypothetical protein
VIALFASLAVTIFAVVYWPRTYGTEVRILAQRNFLLPALGNPTRAVPREADAPTRNVADHILRRDNVVSLIKQVNLMDRWDAERPPLLAWKDHAAEMVTEAPSEEDRMRALVGVIEKKIAVTSDDTTVTIDVEWTNAHMAFELADALQKNFLDARYDADVNVINDAVAVLEGHAREQQGDVEAALNELQNAVVADNKSVPIPTPAPAPRPIFLPRAPAPAPTAHVTDPKLASDLEDRRLQIRRIEDARAARLAELNRQLDNALLTMAPAHPLVVGIKQRIDDENKDSPELLQLKNDARLLEGQLGTAAPAPTSTPAVAFSPAANAAIASLPPPRLNEDPRVTMARNQLQSAMMKYAEMENRIDAAKIELDIARAAFKYRFTVVHPAEVPKKPRKPNVLAVGAGGFLGSFVLMFLVCAILDFRSGRFIEVWQVERRLKLPLLGEVES